MSELARRVEALRKPLVAAARDGFAGLGDEGLAAALRKVWQPLKSKLGDGDGVWLAWGERLGHFESLERDEQMLEIARGLRMCVVLAPARGVSAGKKLPAVGLPSATTTLPGIGPTLGERLAQAGLVTVGDLLWLLPRGYDDCRRALAPSELTMDHADGHCVVRGVVESVRHVKRGRRGWIDLRLADASDSSSSMLVVRWFNAHGGMAARFHRGNVVGLAGRLKYRQDTWEMSNPVVLAVSADGTIAGDELVIRPRYADVSGVPAAKVRSACAHAVTQFASDVVDAVPEAVLRDRKLPPLAEALLALHNPPDGLDEAELAMLQAGKSEWHRRLSYQELLVLGVSIVRRRRQSQNERAWGCAALDERDLDDVYGFALTGAQRRAVGAIAGDLASDRPMNRLLQGDVGCGKTAVAFAAVAQVVAGGAQAAIMAPTEILAEQHARGLSRWCAARGIVLAKITANTPRAVRSSTLALLAAGQIDVVVGTHALLADSVVFAKLALVVIDEQHRFGVAQRARLRAKGDGACPHLLVMTATPIPRSLALTVYGDLDATVVDEMPAGRTPSRTHVLSGKNARRSVYRALQLRLQKGERAFVVCPLVAPNEDGDRVGRAWADAESVHAELHAKLAPHRVALVHGRMASDDRDCAMDEFRRGDAQVLVATTVIEVGVDVPEATVMIVEDADRFGLAQLHQLRGRVGRGGGPSECVLLTSSSASDDGAERLDVIASNHDGFAIAEQDLRLRGPGELLGVRQAGLPRLRFGDLRDQVDLLQQARSDAEAILDVDPELSAPEHAALAAELDDPRWSGEVHGAESG